MQAVHYNPGIPGFIKAHRHPEGPVLVMSRDEQCGFDWISVYWVHRLSPHAQAWNAKSLILTNKHSRRFAEQLYEVELTMGPPPNAYADFQRARVYQWEQAVIFPRFGSLTWIGCKRFLNRVWREVGEGKPPELVNDRRFRDPISLEGVIHLPKDDASCRIKPIILHEIAHEITAGWHGPEFVSTYIDLCAEFLPFERCFLIDSAERYGVECRSISR